jgi:hypothetical protein
MMIRVKDSNSVFRLLSGPQGRQLVSYAVAGLLPLLWLAR